MVNNEGHFEMLHNCLSYNEKYFLPLFKKITMFIRYFRTVCLEYKRQKTSDMLVCTGVCREKKKRQGTREVILFSGNSKHLNKISQKLSLIFIIKLISNIMENHNISNLFLKTYFSTKIASTFKETRVQQFGWWSIKFSPL